MAASPATRPRERRPVEAQHVPGPLGPRALRFGLRATLLAPLGAAASVAIVADQDPKAGSFVPLVIAIAAGGIAVTFLPWDRLAGSAWGRRVLHVWAALDVLLITLAGWSAAGADAALPLGYAVTIVFFAVVFPPRAQVGYLVAVLASYGLVLASSGFELLPFAMLGVVGLLACFLSRELRRRIASHERARIGAERRWAVIGAVSSAARDMTGPDPSRVLEGVVDAIRSLGYPAAAIHLVEGDAARTVLPSGIGEDAARAVGSLPDAVRSDVVEGKRAIVVTAGRGDRRSTRALRASGLEALAAVPIVVGEGPAAVLLVGSAEPDTFTASELDAFSMLAAQAGLAIVSATRIEERRAVAERLADADRIENDVVTRLSREIRKPLAIVAETSRTLKEHPDVEGRDRLLARLASSATALDVTLGGLLDLSLLQADQTRPELREVDLGELVSRVAGRLEGLFEGRELRLHVPEGLTVQADPALIERAVENLLATAATSTPPRRAVEVAVTRAEGQTVVKVAGDGVIPAEQLERIKQPFAAGTEGTAGPIVRLALASRILELHGTELEIRSEAKIGTRVWFQLPGTREPKPALAGIAPPTTEPVQLTLDDALLPAVAARASLAVPPPPEVEEEEDQAGPGRIGAAAAALATAASTMVVTGLVPDFGGAPNPVTANAPDHDGQKRSERRDAGAKDRERNDERDPAAGGTSGGGSTVTPTDGGSTGGTVTGGSGTGSSGTGTGGTGDGTGGGSGDGGGGGTGGGVSEDPPPPGQDGTPGKSDEAPGHNKPSPSPSPSP